jgi:hypothetical protein
MQNMSSCRCISFFSCRGAGLQLFGLRRGLTALRLHRSGGKTISLLKRMALKREIFQSRKLFFISLQQPQGRLLGDPGRGEDPFRKQLAEPGPPGKHPERRKQGSVYLYIKNTLPTA